MWNDNLDSIKVEVSKKFLVECVPYVAWGVVCSTSCVLPEWLDEKPHGKIPELFRLLKQGDERAIAFISEVAAKPDQSDDSCITWQILMDAIKA